MCVYQSISLTVSSLWIFLEQVNFKPREKERWIEKVVGMKMMRYVQDN